MEKKQKNKKINELNINIAKFSDQKKPLIDRLKYVLRKYSTLAERMNELVLEYKLTGNYNQEKEAKIKRNCYIKFINDLTQLLK